MHVYTYLPEGWNCLDYTKGPKSPFLVTLIHLSYSGLDQLSSLAKV
jgi:hypothetical protein